MPATTHVSILSDAMLKRFADRAPGYDRDNRFFTEDFDEMKQAGYLTWRCRASSVAAASPSPR